MLALDLKKSLNKQISLKAFVTKEMRITWIVFFSFLCYELENYLDNTCFLYLYMQFNHVVLKLITYDILSLFCKSFFSYLIRWKPVIHVRYRDIQYRKLKTVLKARRNGRRLLQGKSVKITLCFVVNQRGLSTIVSSAHLLTKH